jgi:hypothetical protein
VPVWVQAAAPVQQAIPAWPHGLHVPCMQTSLDEGVQIPPAQHGSPLLPQATAVQTPA